MVKFLMILLPFSLIAQEIKPINIVNGLASYWSCVTISNSLKELHIVDSVDTNTCIPSAIQSVKLGYTLSYTIKF